ncbi:hypothetical protein CROQUDRAFT_72854 [Cronartium quercuum f. sp. fusiforme G11]|uniref:Pheromone-processing carboxypeptidase KEX1 n=1 Tax=Cronartium quercuum f. sp. fusiforme G11 TaxID=708437 RepID=A0A9P6NW24_9BASI|nr:hypothetical protein CROQUDRAFT_72854 [Cronartium quercuum f. sp. fusiforme G11]
MTRSSLGPSTSDGLQKRTLELGLPLRSELQRRRETHPSLQSRQSSSSTNSTYVTPSAADFYIPSLPGQPSTSTLVLYGGHLPFWPLDISNPPAEEDESYGFFFLNRARHIANKPILMVWLNGGPGCSSFDGSLMEIGPLRMVLKGDGKLREAEGAWNEYVNILFIDQPTGTGYSTGTESTWPHELSMSSDQLLNFLLRFYAVFPEFQHMDLYIGGESFAGQYIPYLADAYLKKASFKAPLRGLIIGNGWIDPINQYLAYHEFAFHTGLVDASSPAGKAVMEKVSQCNDTINEFGGFGHVPIHIPGCEGILSAITDSTVQTVNSQKMCLNMYDIRLVDTYPACGMKWPPDLADMKPYLSRADVKKAFHAERKTDNWVECNGRVGNSFSARNSAPSVTLLPHLLEKLEILLFSGDQDLICCYTGTEKMIDNLTWNGQRGWTSASSALEWKVNATLAGRWRQERNLTYALMANASHMAPYDVPFVAQDMLIRFLQIDILAAAGSAAQISSRAGAEAETLLHRVHLNNTPLLGAMSDTGPVVALKGAVAADAGYYNASSAGIIIVLLGGALGLLFLWRRRLRRDGRGDFAEDGGPITIRDHVHHPDRVKFMPVSTEDNLRSHEHEGHELEELVVDQADFSGNRPYDSVDDGKFNGKGKNKLTI